MTRKVGLGIVTAFIVVALFAPWIAPYQAAVRAGRPFEPP